MIYILEGIQTKIGFQLNPLDIFGILIFYVKQKWKQLFGLYPVLNPLS